MLLGLSVGCNLIFVFGVSMLEDFIFVYISVVCMVFFGGKNYTIVKGIQLEDNGYGRGNCI